MFPRTERGRRRAPHKHPRVMLFILMNHRYPVAVCRATAFHVTCDEKRLSKEFRIIYLYRRSDDSWETASTGSLVNNIRIYLTHTCAFLKNNFSIEFEKRPMRLDMLCWKHVRVEDKRGRACGNCFVMRVMLEQRAHGRSSSLCFRMPLGVSWVSVLPHR